MFLVSCTTTKPLANPTLNKETLSEQLNVEDRIQILKTDGEDYSKLIIDSIEDDYFLCHDNTADVIIIPYAEIDKVEKHYSSPGKTLLFTVGAVGIIYGILYGFASVSF
jgi:hypothetical protein